MRTTKIITKNKIRIAIAESEHRVEIFEIDKDNCGVFGMSVEIHKDSFSKDAEWEVSWASIGSQKIEKAKRYISLLEMAIRIAKDKNLTSSKK